MPLKKHFITKEEDEKKLVLTLTLTRQCNLRCKYCYEHAENFDGRVMAFELARKIISQYMEADDAFEHLEIQFFGGEPMLEFPLIKRIVEWFHSRTWKKGHIFFICTNGTILTEEMKKWLTEHKKCVVVAYSIDGNKKAHDLGRSSSYDQLKRNLPFFQKMWPSQAAKMTIYAETLPYVADSIIELEEMELNFTANFVFENIWGNVDRKRQLLEIYQEQLFRLVNYYVQHPHLEPVGPILGRALEYIDSPLHRDEKGDCLRYCGAGHSMVMVDVDGETYPCHRFAPWITNRPAPQSPVNHQKNWQPEKCANCRYVSLCPTCAGYNWEINGDSGARTDFHCEAFKLELLASAKLVALRLTQKSITDIEEIPANEAVIVKRKIDSILNLVEEGIR